MLSFLKRRKLDKLGRRADYTRDQQALALYSLTAASGLPASYQTTPYPNNRCALLQWTPSWPKPCKTVRGDRRGGGVSGGNARGHSGGSGPGRAADVGWKITLSGAMHRVLKVALSVKN